MRWLLCLGILGCGSSDSPPPDPKPAHKPPDELDEKMRHCPLALSGANATLEDIDNGVRFTITTPDAQVDEVRKRAHHVVEFAAKHTRNGHGEFDGKGGGHMKNCPVVTDDVTITATDIDHGARLDILTEAEHADALRAEAKARADKFSFAGATIHRGAPQH